MELSLKTSKKIIFLSFIMSLVVVFRHCMVEYLLFKGIVLNCSGFDYYFQNLLSDVWGQIAVPFFFIVSGFFMIGKYQKGFRYFKDLCIKKLSGLIMPYLFWTTTAFIVMFAIQNIPGISRFFNSDLILDKSFLDNIKDILNARYVQQFWYLQHLILLTVISPFLFLYAKWTKWLGLIPVFLAYCLVNISFQYLNFGSIFYFLCGGIISMYPKILIFRVSKKWIIVFSIFFFVLSLFLVFMNYTESINWLKETLWDKVIILIGIIYAWLIYDPFSDAIWNFKYSRIYNYSFALYALHYSTLLVSLKKLFLLILGTSEFSLFLTYILTFMATIFICLVVIDVLAKHVPKMYNIMIGGRLLKRI